MQTFTADWYAQNYNAATAFGQAEANDNALKSNFSGATAPSNPEAGMPWYHTGKGLRVRNAANGAWLKTLQGDANSKTYFYRNDTAEGWLVDSNVPDRVLAIKGGSAAFNVNGGSAAGSWTVSGLSAAAVGVHSHGAGSLAAASHAHSLAVGTQMSTSIDMNLSPTTTQSGPLAVSGSVAADGSHAHTISQDGSSRPAAAVGTLQYPDLS